MKNIMIVYPPGRVFQRGEDRCQIDVNASFVNCIRACNDMGYMSACLKRSGYNTFIKDYQGENLDLQDFLNDIKKYNPDVLCISTTNGSIFSDLNVIEEAKNIKNDITVVLKGALFFNPDKNFLDKLDLSKVDYLIGGEVEFIIENLINAHFNDKSQLKTIQGISYKNNGGWVIQKVEKFNDDLDSLPFPDRTLMKNELYINPLTNRPMAIITSDKGCPYCCIYCLSPVISGNKIRFRSVDSIFSEIKECIEKYNICDFFFKSDTFTANRTRIIQLCELLINSGLNKKITWTASSRVDVLDEELVKTMKKAGCSLLALGFESGSQDSLNKMNKKTTVEQNLYAAKLCKKYGIKILGHFLIGFNWEDETHLKDTKKHIFEIDADFIEISIAVPYYKTPLYESLYGKNNVDIENILGHDSYRNIVENVSKFSSERLKNFKRNTALEFYLRPKYIIKCFSDIKSPAVMKNYIKCGLRMIKNCILN